VHIDYKKAARVIQRFGDVQKLVEQTLDPMVSAYFKNTAQTKTLIELLQQRADIQGQALAEMKEKFDLYNLELQEVLIGTPRSAPGSNDQIENILVQLRDRQVAREQVETYARQEEAAIKERTLREAEAVAAQQKGLTQSRIAIEMAENKGLAEVKTQTRQGEADAARIRIGTSHVDPDGSSGGTPSAARGPSHDDEVPGEGGGGGVELTPSSSSRRALRIAHS
jgi:uncharacterized membrane protein YqiK